MVLKTFLLLIINSLQNDMFIKDLRFKTFSATGDVIEKGERVEKMSSMQSGTKISSAWY